MTQTAASSPAPARYAGLDGMRAIAVALVVVYHLFPASWVKGGFIGVDVFFVISGFLITSLLLRPSARVGTTAGLIEFWRRRARRLLPALALLLTVCATAGWLIGGDVLVGLGPQVLGATTFSYNWVSIAEGGGYFAAGTPELFRNLWSLAVEEQFYVLWPLLLPLVLLVRSAWGRAAIALAAAGASAAWMAALIGPGSEPTRAYFGTDSHAFGILIGVALAFLVARMPRRSWMERDETRLGLLVVGISALVGLAVLGAMPPTGTTTTFPGALLAASGLSAVAIFVAVWPGSWFGRGLDNRVMAWFGDRSYGIYLWHWPVLVLLVAELQGTTPDAGVPVSTGLLALAVTLVVSAASYRWLERPIRRLGFRASLRLLGDRLTGTPATRFAALVIVVTGALAVTGTTVAVASAPRETSAEQAILAGQAALEAQAETPTATPDPSPPPATLAPTSPTPAPTPVTGGEITAIGDSVMLAAAPALVQHFPGIAVDAAVSRSMWAAPEMLDALAASGQLRPYVIVALGTNGPVDVETLSEMATIVGTDRHLVLVNSFAPRDWIPGVNAELASFAATHPRVSLADWSSTIAPRVDLLAGDQIHPGTGGGELYAQTMDASLAEIERQSFNDRMRAQRIENGLLEVMPH